MSRLKLASEDQNTHDWNREEGDWEEKDWEVGSRDRSGAASAAIGKGYCLLSGTTLLDGLRGLGEPEGSGQTVGISGIVHSTKMSGRPSAAMASCLWGCEADMSAMDVLYVPARFSVSAHPSPGFFCCAYDRLLHGTPSLPNC